MAGVPRGPAHQDQGVHGLGRLAESGKHPDGADRQAPQGSDLGGGFGHDPEDGRHAGRLDLRDSAEQVPYSQSAMVSKA